MRRLAVVILCVALTGCGFHLRTAHEFALPPALSTVRVTMTASSLKYPGLVLVVRRALLDRGVDVVTSGNVPSVVLLSESLAPVIVTINSNGGASAYLLNYAVTFSVEGPGGRVLMGPMVVRVQREYSFDVASVLAMAREQAYLEKRMRIAAARQIVWRLAFFKGPKARPALKGEKVGSVPPGKKAPHAP
ncbi:MAG: LPS-assembly lipoprotein LptE [Acidiferrobacter sp.]